MDLHIHLVPHESQTDGQSLSRERHDAGYHALVAFEILRRPFAEFRGRIWNRMMAGPLIEAWDRQIHLIESLHLPGPDPYCNPAFELRFIASPGRSQVDIFFLAKAFAPTAEQARSAALALSQEVFSLFPFDFVLHPLPDWTEFDRAYRSEWIADLKHSEQIVEIRRFERLVACPDRGNGINPIYLTSSWEWHLQSMDQVWCALAKYQQPLMFSINLSPVLWDQVDYVYLNNLEAVANRGAFPPTLTPEIESVLNLYRLLLYRTPRPFKMRTVLAGIPSAPRGLANAVGAGLCTPQLQVGDDETKLNVHYTLAWPTTPTDFSFAKFNLTQLSQYDWGTNLASLPIRRLRYAVNAKLAQAAFRIPIPPEAGFPDISLGREVDR